MLDGLIFGNTSFEGGPEAVLRSFGETSLRMTPRSKRLKREMLEELNAEVEVPGRLALVAQRTLKLNNFFEHPAKGMCLPVFSIRA